MRTVNRKVIAGLELVLMVVSIFSFSYMVNANEGLFDKTIEEDKTRVEGVDSALISVAKMIYLGIKKPMVPRASAAGSLINDEDSNDFEDFVGGAEEVWNNRGWLTESETATSVAIGEDALSLGAGCCSQAVDGNFCVVSSAQNCDGVFAEGATCAQTSFCRKGCCYDPDTGIYDKNVLQTLCQEEWVADPNCNLPGAVMGCCVLGTQTIYETQGQCEVDTVQRAMGEDAVVDWRSGTNELQCVLLSQNQSEGACVLSGGNCRFVTEGDCLNDGGQFNEGYLCTAVSLSTSCEPTEHTTCVEGKDQVYFKDSCGNPANIYDSSKINDQSYWETVVKPEDSCGASSDNGNAKDKNCGNCNRVIGGFCSSAARDSFKVNYGENYCKDTSCTYKGENYKNGESWCIYDGAIGNGDDVVGSRHWKYVCNQGEINIEPCADYRNQICIQSNTFDVGGTDIQFRNANCIANNWRECINLNSEEDGMERCEETLNCMIDNVQIADKFNFDVCVPKYPGGFAIRDSRYQETAETICGQATQTCTVVRAAKFSGGCKYVANKGCLEEGFAQEMNEWCTSLGDCGMEANIIGEMNENNYEVRKSPRLSSGWVSKLAALARPVPGQYAEAEDYSEYLEAAGLWGVPSGEVTEGEDDAPLFKSGHAMGLAGIGYAMGITALYLAPSMSVSLGLSGLSTVAGGMEGLTLGAPANLASFAGAAIGAGIGMFAGLYIAKAMGLSPLGSTLMAVGGAMVGGAIGYAMLNGGLATLGASCAAMGPLCIVLIIGIIIMVIASFFGGAKCEPIEVEFECKVWQPPIGGSDCEECNGDPLKPCSEYRCQSLGTACELINKGTEEELCIDGHRNDTQAPVVSPQLGLISDTGIYSDITDRGFSVTSIEGGCIDAYTPLVFGIKTDEPSYCKFDMTQKAFGEMSYDLGSNSYVYNHTTAFALPDPSHGESQGLNFNGDLTLYIMCQDVKGHVTPNYYTIDMCVNEGPDVRGPVVMTTKPTSGGKISYDSTSENISVITNELSTCRWAESDIDYTSMNEMTCDTSLTSPSSPLGYLCYAEVPVTKAENNYYIRCIDQPWLEGIDEDSRNEGQFLFKLLKPTEKISIDWIEPSKDFEIATDGTSIEVEVQTSGGGDYHTCSYSFSGYENMIKFYTSDGNTHAQPLNRPAGRQKIYVECEDFETGDIVQGFTEFEIIKDTATPQVARVWQEGGNLKFITTEYSECKFSTKTCNFKWAKGLEAGSGESHSISVVKGNTYFIKCKDEFGNVPSDCSIRVRAL